MKHRYLWFLALILLMSFFLRIFRLEELFYFTHDEETIVWRVMPLLRDGDIFLLGGVSPLHVHLGPWFYYLSAAVLYLFQLNPLGWGVVGALVGVLTTGLLFRLGDVFYGRRVGFVAALLYATSLLMVVFDRHWWPLVFNPLVCLVVIYSLLKLIKKKYWYGVSLSLALTLGFHSDPSTWGLFLLVAFVWFKYRLPIKHKLILFSLGIFLFSFVPLAVFDVKHKGANFLGVNRYLSETRPHLGLSWDRFVWTLEYIPKTLGRLLIERTADVSWIHAYCTEHSLKRMNEASVVGVFLSLVILIYFLFRKTKNTADWLVRWYLVAVIVGVGIYGNFFSSDLFDHYLATLFPLFFLMAAVTVDVLWKSSLKIFVLVLLVVVIGFNVIDLFKLSNSSGYKKKINAVEWVVDELGDEKFSLDSLGRCFGYSGVRYLFMLAGKEPVMSFVDPNFFWLYSVAPELKQPDKLVVFVVRDGSEDVEFEARYMRYLEKLVDKNEFGQIEVLIVDNSEDEFEIVF